MEIITGIVQLNQYRKPLRGVALVPTMGNLHAGHLSLIKLAQSHAERVIVSLFVNPLQFGPNEDFDKYPRTFKEDCQQLAAIGVNAVFSPTVEEIYPVKQEFLVHVPAIGNELCGASRPGHFQGVATVVLKLFNIVQPNIAVFGKKDFQQLFIIKRMVTEFNLPIGIIASETSRAEDGLALSSRNSYLTEQERKEASRLYQSLQGLSQKIKAGNTQFTELAQITMRELEGNGWKPDYVSVRDRETLQLAKPSDKNLIVLAAAALGKTRLIDNIEVCNERQQGL